MNRHQKEMVDRLDAMSLEEARKELASGKFGDIDSPNYSFCSAWLSVKEASLCNANASEAAKWARRAAYAAYAAAILTGISIVAAIVIAILETLQP
jgi:type IV secretory pathway component VirB8